MRIKNTEIYRMDVVVVVGTLLVLVSAGFYARPLLLSPLDETITTNSSVLFSLERGDAILIDDNPEFTSPDRIVMKDALVVTLQPGIYYWSVEGIFQSEVRKLVIVSTIDLQLEANGTQYDVVNAGNVETDVRFYENESFLAGRVVGVRERTTTVGTRAEGAQHG